MTDTAKTDNIPNSNDIPKDQSSPLPLETPEINSINAAESFPQNNSGANAFEQPVGGGDSGIPLNTSEVSVVVPSNNGKAPKWFYLIFILTLIIFIAVTVLLVLSVMQKSNSANNAVPKVIPAVTKAVVPPSVIPLPTIEATDAGTLKISQVSGSDEIKDIENDIKTTDFSPIETGLSALDRELDFKTSL